MNTTVNQQPAGEGATGAYHQGVAQQLVGQRNMFADQLAHVSGLLAAAQARIAELEAANQALLASSPGIGLPAEEPMACGSACAAAPEPRAGEVKAP